MPCANLVFTHHLTLRHPGASRTTIVWATQVVFAVAWALFPHNNYTPWGPVPTALAVFPRNLPEARTISLPVSDQHGIYEGQSKPLAIREGIPLQHFRLWSLLELNTFLTKTNESYDTSIVHNFYSSNSSRYIHGASLPHSIFGTLTFCLTVIWSKWWRPCLDWQDSSCCYPAS